jgi:hypothetical protein
MTKDDLLMEIAQSRRSVARDFQAVRDSLDVRVRVASSIRARPLAWIGGAAALGWMLAGPKTKTRVERTSDGRKRLPAKKRPAKIGLFGLLLGLIKLGMPVLKPAFSAYAARRLAEVASKLSH